jgi:hypothetical protein
VARHHALHVPPHHAFVHHPRQPLLLNSANALENVASDGISDARSHPHSILRVWLDLRKSIKSSVVGKFHTAFAMNANLLHRHGWRKLAPGKRRPGGAGRLKKNSGPASGGSKKAGQN